MTSTNGSICLPSCFVRQIRRIDLLLCTLQKLEGFHLHRVVELSAGIKDDYVAASATDANKHHRVNPVEKLKEALSSKEAFQKYYLVSINSMTWKFELSFYGHVQCRLRDQKLASVSKLEYPPRS